MGAVVCEEVVEVVIGRGGVRALRAAWSSSALGRGVGVVAAEAAEEEEAAG